MSEVFASVAEWRAFRTKINSNIGLVTTMGNLHLGHQSLLARSISENAITVLTIFVNPTQFNNKDDLADYPKTFAQDVAVAKKLGVDYVLAPTYADLYPDDYKYKIIETDFSRHMEGAHRPGHFAGVLTVVMKLLLLVRPDKTYFGEKDYQQLKLVTDMANAFLLNTEVVSCPTIRDEYGLALSSRNNHLTSEQLKIARKFPQILAQKLAISDIIKQLVQQDLVVEYVEEHAGRRFAAVRLGKVRLIDNVIT